MPDSAAFPIELLAAIAIWWGLASLIVGFVAEKKGQNMWLWALGSMFFSPLLIAILLAAYPAE